MKAVLLMKFGPPEGLRLQEVPKPVPKENQVLIEVRAASVNAADYRIMRAKPFFLRLMFGGFTKPKDKRVGLDVAGRVEAVGEDVRRFKPGDEVFGTAKGAFAEYALAREENLASKPARASFEEAAALPVAALTALQGLRDVGGLKPGQSVLIQGASGGVGTFAVQLAKVFGADVTAVCSPRNLDLVRSLGADRVLDYTKDDFAANGKTYDLIFAVNGFHPLSAYRRALNPRGRYVCAGGTMSQIFQAMLRGPLLSRKNGKRMRSMGIAKVKADDLAYLGELLEAGKIAPVIDARYTLSDVPEAFRYVEDKHARGKVVISPVQAAKS